jgi:hypothetical protein
VRWICAALLAAGCGAAGFSGPPAADVGTGADRFIALRDGDAVPIVMGLQGGYHVWGSVRASNVASQNVTLRFALYHADDAAPLTVRLDTVDLTSGEHLGTAVFLPDPSAVRGQPCRLRLELTDENGRAASAEHRITPE